MARFRDDPIGAFYQELRECTRQSKFYDPPRPFVLASRLLEWLRERPEVDESSARATIILETVYRGREPWAGAWNHFDERMDKGHNQCWLKLLVILLQVDPDGLFARHLDAFYQAEIWDSRLSDVHRRSAELLEIIQRTGFYAGEDCLKAVNWFLHLATQLSTQRAITMHHMRHLEPHIILPITEKDGINSGGQSNVFRIEVPHECISGDLVNYLKRLQRQAIPDQDYPDGKSMYYEFALKKLARREDWEREIEFHRALRASQTEGIVQCLGSWEVQTDTSTEYYLLMEFGWSDLNQYFRSIPPPSIAQHIYDFWRSLSSVIPALSHIHNLAISSTRSSTVRYYVWHGDIKPANILICDDGIKLTDPGWAQIVLREDAQRDDKGLPVVILSGGTGSYGGPERIDQRTGKVDGNRPVTQRFDIWSLACVFLEAATWVILGVRGVDQFRTARKMAHKRSSSNDNIGDDCFHDLGRASFVIGDWIEYLKRGIRAEDLVSGQILDIIKDEMLLVQPHERISSEDLARRVDGTLRSCEDAISKLPRYTFPRHLEPAFDLEQKIAAQVWENPQSRAPSAKPMLDRSVRFAQPRGPLMDHAQPHGQPAADPRTSGPSLNLPTDPAFYGDALHYGVQSQFAPQHPYIPPAQYPHPAQSAQTAQWPAATKPPNRSPVRTPTRDSASTIAVPPEEKQPKFDYYDALNLLITGRGWVYSSSLEYPDSRVKPPIPTNPGTSKDTRPSSQYKEAGGRASTWSTLTRTTSVKKGEKNSGYSSALAQAFHKFKPSSKSSKVSNANSRVASSSNSRPGVAPVQSMKPDTTFGALFDDRDIIILVDNSSNMVRHWPQMQNILPLLMAMMWGQDDDGIDLFFTSSTVPYERLMEPWQVIGPLKEKDPKLRRPGSVQSPAGSSTEKDPDDIYKVLSHILSIIGPGDKYSKKATILILTDGVWPKSNQEVVAEVISHWLRRMSTVVDGAADAVLNDRYYSIQFVQLGDDPEGTKALEYLDDDLPKKYNVPDVIDVEPANGNVLKMVMGSLDDIWDEKPQSSVENASPKPETPFSKPEPSTSPPVPLPHQYLNQRALTGSTWSTTARGTGFNEPIYEEPEMHYAAQPTRQQGLGPQRASPPVPPGANYGGLGIPIHQHPYGFQQQPPPFTPQQPQRRATGQAVGYGLSTPPEESPSRPQRRRDTGGFGGTMGHH